MSTKTIQKQGMLYRLAIVIAGAIGIFLIITATGFIMSYTQHVGYIPFWAKELFGTLMLVIGVMIFGFLAVINCAVRAVASYLFFGSGTDDTPGEEVEDHSLMPA